jgi:hypothetical protein
VRPKTLAIPSPIEMTVPNSLRSFYTVVSLINENGVRRRRENWKWALPIKPLRTKSHLTYHLVDLRNFRLEDGDGISN